MGLGAGGNSKPAVECREDASDIFQRVEGRREGEGSTRVSLEDAQAGGMATPTSQILCMYRGTFSLEFNIRGSVFHTHTHFC